MQSNKILFGAAYYDEYMPYDRIQTDMQLMKKAGMNVIRIAESTWSTVEPRDNVFDFSHLDRMLDASEHYDLKVIIGTPTYAVPAWLVKKYPDILAVTHAGKELYGRRQNMDITHPLYLRHAERVIRSILEHIKDRKTIIGFQLDNETKAYDTCSPLAQKMFLYELMDRFPDINRFNLEFGLDYWSNRINSWDDFPDIRGTINASLGAEFEKFQRKLVSDFLAWQSAIVNEYRKDYQFITHNFDFDWRGYSFGYQSQVDQFEAAKCMTVAGVDIYHPSQEDLTGAEISFAGAIGRGLKRDNYLVLETQAQGNLSWLPYEGQLRQQAYSHISSGAGSVLYWNWHSIHNSFESYWKGVLSHDFSENATYLEAKRIGREFEQLGSKILNLKKRCKIAFMLSNEALTGLKWFPAGGRLQYNDIFRWLYDAFYRMNLECDVISPEFGELSEYSVIVIPALYSASENTLRRISEYVKNGGHILATFKTGFSNEHLKIYSDSQPHLLTECFGMSYNQFTAPNKAALQFETGPAEVSEWMELLIPTTAAAWHHYIHRHWGKYAAVTHNRYEAGTATYLGCYFDGLYLEEIITRLWKELGLTLPEYHFPVICKEGINSDGMPVQFYFNYSDEEQDILYRGPQGKLLLEDEEVHQDTLLLIKPWDVKIIEGGIQNK